MKRTYLTVAVSSPVTVNRVQLAQCATELLQACPIKVFEGVIVDAGNLVHEAIAEIALLAGSLHAKGEIDYDDSRDFIQDLILWAEEYQDTIDTPRANDPEYNFMEEIERFANKRLVETYGE